LGGLYPEVCALREVFAYIIAGWLFSSTIYVSKQFTVRGNVWRHRITAVKYRLAYT
jgi:hypothetical protein